MTAVRTTVRRPASGTPPWAVPARAVLTRAVLVPVLVLSCAANATTVADRLGRVGFEPRVGASLPLQAEFRDEAGRAVRLADFFGHAPVVLVFTYYGCTKLCPAFVAQLAGALGKTGRAPGKDYRVVIVSIDPRDDPTLAARAKSLYLADADAAAAPAWHVLTGAQGARRVAAAAGVRYAWDADTSQYAHPAGMLIVTPAGTVARYFADFGWSATELAEAFDDAAADRLTAPVERLLLLCFHDDGIEGRHTGAVLAALRAAALAFAGAMVLWLLRSRRGGRAGHGGRG